MKNKILDRVIKQYVKEKLVPLLNEETRKLITYANYDLWFGPLRKGFGPFINDDDSEYEWVGFTKACKLISRAIDDLNISNVYVDISSEEVLEHEPEYETEEDYIFAIDSGDIWEVNKEDLLKELLGKELYNYI